MSNGNGKDAKVELKIKNNFVYAIEVECDEPETRHFKHISTKKKGGALARVPPILQGQQATIVDGFSLSAKKYAERPCMGNRFITECKIEGKKQFWTKGDYQWRSYKEVAEDVRKAACGLIELSAVKARKAEGGMCVGAILAETSSEWHISAQAAFQCGITITTVYTTLGHDAMVHGMNETEATVLFLDWDKYNAIRDAVIAKCPKIKHIVLIGKVLVPLSVIGGTVDAFPTVAEAEALGGGWRGLTVSTLEGLIAAGENAPVDLTPYAPAPEDVAFIMYTSGSTGMPKGVVLTHANFIACMAGIIEMECITPGFTDVYIAYLPLAHILELMVETICLCQGCRIGYGHPRSLTSNSVCIHPSNPEGADLLALRPTLMAAVPAIMDLIKTGLTMKLQRLPGFTGKLVRASVAKSQGLSGGEGCFAGCLAIGLGSLMLKKIREQMGLEKIRVIVSGGAPLAAETQRYVTGVIAPIAQGYGATETCGMCSMQEVISFSNRRVDRSYGTVGSIAPCTEVKLLSVPDMGYLVTDKPPRGEILISGHNVAYRGYFKMPQKSAEDFPVHSDGKVWFHTGDVGVLTERGTLKIIDRKKDLIKLSGGEYVSLGKVEAGLKQVPGIGAVVVFAQAHKDHCVCVVSQPEKGWASVGGKPEEASLIKAIAETLRGMGFARFEIPTKVKVDDLIWTPESNLVTASLKVQRNPLREHYNAPGGLLAAMDYTFPVA